MFLERLTEREKGLFMNLANIVARADGKVVDSECISLNYYAREMETSYEPNNEINNVDIVLAELNETCNDETKRIFALELLALAFVDKEYNEAEEELMKKICGSFGIGNKDYYKLLYMVIDYVNDLTKMSNFIEKGE